MADIGGLGGLGGFTYPVRYGVPQSSVVPYNAMPQAWGQDFQARYNEAAQPMRLPTRLIEDQVSEYANRTGTGEDPTKLQSLEDFADSAFRSKDTPLREKAIGMFGDDFSQLLRSYDLRDALARHSAPDLNNEKNLMMPIEQAAQRSEQAYQMQNGWGQTNGIMSADYSDPNFGQVNGEFGQAKLGAPSVGADPKSLFNTMPTGAVANTIWGAAPQRVRQWGI